VIDDDSGSAPRQLRLVWDEQKNLDNVRKHGLSFADAPLVFRSQMVVGYDDREEYGEDRWIGIGLLTDIVVVIVFTEPDPLTVRIISLRKALRHERQRYYREVTH
jgi:uncharacterized protein